MEKIWAKDVKEGDRPKSVFLVARKATPTSKSGKTYLSVTFHDKTGELEARAFEKLEELGAAVRREGPRRGRGDRRDLPGQAAAPDRDGGEGGSATGLDAAEFVWAPPPEPKKPEKHRAAASGTEPLWKELARPRRTPSSTST